MAHEERFMFLFVFFDLPVKTKNQRKEATKFRNYLLKTGFMMIQFSVYAKLCRGTEMAEGYIKKVRANLTTQGSIRTLLVTDKQFERMDILMGEKKPTEKAKFEQLILL